MQRPLYRLGMITPLYAAALTLVFIALSARVILYRRANQIGLGDQGDKGLLKRIRAQGNCAEYAPMGVLLMLLVELQNAQHIWLHGIGTLLLAGRLLHAVGFSARPPIMALRVWGMILTLLSFLMAIGCILLLSLSGG